MRKQGRRRRFNLTLIQKLNTSIYREMSKMRAVTIGHFFESYTPFSTQKFFIKKSLGSVTSMHKKYKQKKRKTGAQKICFLLRKFFFLLKVFSENSCVRLSLARGCLAWYTWKKGNFIKLHVRGLFVCWGKLRRDFTTSGWNVLMLKSKKFLKIKIWKINKTFFYSTYEQNLMSLSQDIM